jgi:RimJ/RimL family protein N-acetyltransferase
MCSTPDEMGTTMAERDIAWPRAVVVDGEVVGFLMLGVEPQEEHSRPYWQWRLMLGAAHQRRGHGSAALASTSPVA